MNLSVNTIAALVGIGILHSLCATATTADDRESVDSTANRPNVLWITLEDISPNLGCYGDDQAITPRMDELAHRGVRYTNCWSPSGLCSPSRSCLITGMIATSLGTIHQRCEGRLPAGVEPFPVYLRQAGYYCSNHSKTDYNFEASSATWDQQHNDWRKNGWTRRKPDQSFFTVINLGVTHSSQIYKNNAAGWRGRLRTLKPSERHDPAKMDVPPYYPDSLEVREELVHYYDNITYADRQVGEILDQLQADGLADDTIVFLFSDHGRGMPRGKGWCYAESLHVPLIVHVPPRFAKRYALEPGCCDDRLVSFTDFAPTVLSLCGVDRPEHLEGRVFTGSDRQPAQPYLFAHRDRMDERYEVIRSLYDGRYHYVRNYLPHFPWLHEQTRNYPSEQPSYRLMHRLESQGLLGGADGVLMRRRKPREELYDLSSDPHEVHNLADSDKHNTILSRFRSALSDQLRSTRDLGFVPESQVWLRMLNAAPDAAPHTLIRKFPSQFAFDRALNTADMVGADPPSLQTLIDRLEHDPDPAVRYWAAMGILAAGRNAMDAKSALRRALQDEFPSVRTIAAHALCALGDPDSALKVLAQDLDHPNPYVTLRIANTLDHLDEKARPIQPEIQSFLQSQPHPSQGGKYTHLILNRVAERLSYESR